MKALICLLVMVFLGVSAEADEMASQLDFCQKLAAAKSAKSEQNVLAEWQKLPPPMRGLRYGVRRVADGKILKSDEFTADMLKDIEVVLYCEHEGGEKEVVWRPKSAESLALLMME